MNRLTLNQALAENRLPDFIAQAEHDGVGPANKSEFEAATTTALVGSAHQASAVDILDRLRAMYSHRGDGIPTQFVNPDGEEAARELEALSAENKRLREALERAADELECVIGEGYASPPNKVDTCEHGKYGWEDCIACYDERLLLCADQIRSGASAALNPEQG